MAMPEQPVHRVLLEPSTLAQQTPSKTKRMLQSGVHLAVISMWEGGEMLSPLRMMAWDLAIADLLASPFFLFIYHVLTCLQG